MRDLYSKFFSLFPAIATILGSSNTCEIKREKILDHHGLEMHMGSPSDSRRALNRQLGQHQIWTIGVYRKQDTGAMEVAQLGACRLVFDRYKINHYSIVRRRVGLEMMLPPSCPLFQNV